MEHFAIRRAVLDDADEIVRVVNAAYRNDLDEKSKAWTTEARLVKGPRIELETARKNLVDVEQLFIFVAAKREEGKICGTVQVTPNDDAGFIGMLSVDPEMQTAGLGKKLLSFAEDFIKNELVLSFARMRVLTERPELLQFYHRRGYEKRGEPFEIKSLSSCEELKQQIHFILLEKKL